MIFDPFQAHRDQAIKNLPKLSGCYVLHDPRGRPLYVGQSKDGILSRVRRHITSARSDPVASRAIDPSIISFVDVYPCPREVINTVEQKLIFSINETTPLLNGNFAKSKRNMDEWEVPQPMSFQILPDEAIDLMKCEQFLLERYLKRLQEQTDYMLHVKNTSETRRINKVLLGIVTDLHEKVFNQAAKSKKKKKSPRS